MGVIVMSYGNIKIMVFSFLIIVLIGVLSGCINGPKSSVVSFLKALKRVDYEDASKYILGDFTFQPNEKYKNTYKVFFHRLDYNIDNIVVDTEKAIVTITLKNVDFFVLGGKLLGEITSLKLASIFNGEPFGEKEINSLILKRFTANDAPQKKNTLDVVLKKINGVWLIVLNKELETSILGDVNLLGKLYETISEDS